MDGLDRGVDDRGERVDLERCAADQRAVDVREGEELRGVLRLYAAAVEDPRALGLLAVAVGDQRADERDRVLGLLGCRRQPGADRPDRLVGDRDRAELIA